MGKRYGTLFSSNGEIVFRVSDGWVIKSRSDWKKDPGYKFDMPTRVDIDEWRSHYPGEDVTTGHDILDFGLWFDETYFPPDADFREEYEKNKKGDSDCPKEK